MINEHKLILNPSFLSQRILPLVSVGTSAIGIIAAGTSAGAILVGSYKLKDEVVCSTFGGGVAVVHQPQGVGYLEADVDALDVFHGAVFGQFGGTAFKGGVEDAEAVQTDTVAVRQRLAYLSYDGLPTCSTSSADMAPSASMSCAIRARSKILASWGLRFRV